MYEITGRPPSNYSTFIWINFPKKLVFNYSSYYPSESNYVHHPVYTYKYTYMYVK